MVEEAKPKLDFKRSTKEEIIARQQEAVNKQDHLMSQTLDNFEVSKVTPLNREIISRQATMNIGTIGHVAHGKSTLVRSVSGTNVSHYLNFFVAHSDLFCIAAHSPLQREAEKHHDQAGLRER